MKNMAEGARVYLDTGKLNQWPEIRDWYLKRRKKRTEFRAFFAQIKDAGHGLFSIQHVQVTGKVRRKNGPSCRLSCMP